MVFRKKRLLERTPGGHFCFEEERTKARLNGFGHGEYIQLRDEAGHVWKGSAQKGDDDTVRYTFRDEKGRRLAGVADKFGITLRDDKGKTWRGIVD